MDWEEITTKYVPIAVGYGLKVVGVLVVLFVAWIIAGWIARISVRGMAKAQLDETLTRFFGKLIKWLILLLAILGCIGAFGINTTSFAAVIGAAGLAVGLAFQGTLANFSAGVMLLVFRPFKVDDVVNVAGQTGKVIGIELFTVTLDTFDNRRIIIPNSAVFGTTIENITHHPIRRADVDVGVDYSADIDRVREILTQAAKSVEGGLEDPEPGIVLLSLGASSVDWSVRVWAKNEDFGAVKQGTTRAVKKALDEAGIGIPYPQMDVHLDSPQPT
jgi:small conductance mechanosensitive channel